MKYAVLISWILAICGSSAAQGKSGATLDAFSQRRGPPALVTPGYRFEDGKLAAISFYEVDKSPLAALSLKRDRFLIYTEDPEFIRTVAWHFESMRDPKIWTGSTMYAALWTPLFGASAPMAKLEIFHFDAQGRLVDERQVRIHVAYLEAGPEGHLIRQPTAR